MNFHKFFLNCMVSSEFFLSHIAEAKEALIFEELLSICRIHNLNPAIVG